MVKIIDVNEKNIDQYGLFCRKSYPKSEGNINKVNWLKKRFKEGLKYKLLIVREYDKDTSRGFIYGLRVKPRKKDMVLSL